MSYDFYMIDRKTNDSVKLPRKVNFMSGTMALGGTDEAWLNITFNYSPFFKKAFHSDAGILCLQGVTASDSVQMIMRAVRRLGNDVSQNYWDATEGNAKLSLSQLLTIALWSPPDAYWEIHY